MNPDARERFERLWDSIPPAAEPPAVQADRPAGALSQELPVAEGMTWATAGGEAAAPAEATAPADQP